MADQGAAASVGAQAKEEREKVSHTPLAALPGADHTWTKQEGGVVQNGGCAQSGRAENFHTNPVAGNSVCSRETRKLARTARQGDR